MISLVIVELYIIYLVAVAGLAKFSKVMCVVCVKSPLMKIGYRSILGKLCEIFLSTFCFLNSIQKFCFCYGKSFGVSTPFIVISMALVKVLKRSHSLPIIFSSQNTAEKNEKD